MNLLKYYQQYRDKWWALPLLLPVLLLPLARGMNTYTMLNGHMVYLYYLPLALVLSTQPDDVFRLGGDPRNYRWSAANAGPGHDAGAGRWRTVPFPDPLRALLGRISHLCSPTAAGIAR